MIKKTQRINLKVTNEDYVFLQQIKEESKMSITKYLTTCMKNTERYKKYHQLLNG